MYARTILFALLASPLLAAVEAAELWQGAKTLDNFSVKNHSGIWFGDSDQVAHSASGVEPNTLPDCAAHQGEFKYTHYSCDDPHYAMIHVDSKGEATLTTAGHKRTTVFKITKVDGYMQTRVNAVTGAVTCAYWRPYVDERTGHLKAQVIGKSEWTKYANGTVTRASITCTAVKGTETAGCYPQGDNKVHTVNVATYTCLNGECAAFAPVYAEHEDH